MLSKPLEIKNLLIIAAVLQVIWGAVPSASQLVINEIPVELYVALRWSISGLVFLSYLLVTGRFRVRFDFETLGVMVLGVLGYGLASFGTLYGLKLGGVTNFALLGALAPVITSVTSIALLGEKPRKLFYLALPLSVTGLIVLVMGKGGASSFKLAVTSAGLVVGACILEALIFVFSKRLKERFSSVEYLAIAQISAAGILWIFQGALFHQSQALHSLSYHGWLAAIFVSLVACVFCYAVLYWLLEQVEGHRLALFEGLHTLSASLFGYLLFRERVTELMLAGGTLLLAGLIIGNWPKRAPDRTSAH